MKIAETHVLLHQAAYRTFKSCYSIINARYFFFTKGLKPIGKVGSPFYHNLFLILINLLHQHAHHH